VDSARLGVASGSVGAAVGPAVTGTGTCGVVVLLVVERVLSIRSTRSRSGAITVDTADNKSVWLVFVALVVREVDLGLVAEPPRKLSLALGGGAGVAGPPA